MSLQMLESEKIQHAAPDKGKKKKDDKKESGQPQAGKVSSESVSLLYILISLHYIIILHILTIVLNIYKGIS